MITTIIVAFLFGLAGSLHCLVMCGPLILAMPRRKPTAATIGKKAIYHGSRISVYMVLGGFVGLGSEVANLAGLAQVVSIAAGTLMVVSAFLHLYTSHRAFGSALLQRLTSVVKGTVSGRLKSKSVVSHAIMGSLNGLLPCGLLVAALFGALATGSLLNAMFFMLFFGVGTLPMLMVVQFAAAFVPEKLIARGRRVVPLLALGMGCLLVVRGLQLGIPYLSPQAPLQHVAAENSCSEIVIKTK